MNIRNCIEMIEFGLNWKDTENKYFDFSVENINNTNSLARALSPHACGTSGCFAGWFAVHKGHHGLSDSANFCMGYIEITDQDTKEDLFFSAANTRKGNQVREQGYCNEEKGMHGLARNMRSWLEKETGKTYSELKAEYWDEPKIERGSWKELEGIWTPNALTA